MKKLLASVAVAVALSFAVPAMSIGAAEAAPKAPVLKVCKMGKGKAAQSWKCQPGQTCCVSPEGKGVCGIAGLGCF